MSVDGTAFGNKMLLSLKNNLPFTTAIVAYQGQEVKVENVLVDTGSASTILAVDAVRSIKIYPLPEDTLHTIHGVGGSETVFSRVVDYVQLGEQRLANLEIEIGGMDYGFEINGILGMDFLTKVGAIINLRNMHIGFE